MLFGILSMLLVPQQVLLGQLFFFLSRLRSNLYIVDRNLGDWVLGQV